MMASGEPAERKLGPLPVWQAQILRAASLIGDDVSVCVGDAVLSGVVSDARAVTATGIAELQVQYNSGARPSEWLKLDCFDKLGPSVSSSSAAALPSARGAATGDSGRLGGPGREKDSEFLVPRATFSWAKFGHPDQVCFTSQYCWVKLKGFPWWPAEQLLYCGPPDGAEVKAQRRGVAHFSFPDTESRHATFVTEARTFLNPPEGLLPDAISTVAADKLSASGGDSSRIAVSPSAKKRSRDMVTEAGEKFPLDMINSRNQAWSDMSVMFRQRAAARQAWLQQYAAKLFKLFGNVDGYSSSDVADRNSTTLPVVASRSLLSIYPAYPLAVAKLLAKEHRSKERREKPGSRKKPSSVALASSIPSEANDAPGVASIQPPAEAASAGSADDLSHPAAAAAAASPPPPPQPQLLAPSAWVGRWVGWWQHSYDDSTVGCVTGLASPPATADGAARHTGHSGCEYSCRVVAAVEHAAQRADTSTHSSKHSGSSAHVDDQRFYSIDLALPGSCFPPSDPSGSTVAQEPVAASAVSGGAASSGSAATGAVPVLHNSPLDAVAAEWETRIDSLVKHSSSAPGEAEAVASGRASGASFAHALVKPPVFSPSKTFRSAELDNAANAQAGSVPKKALSMHVALLATSADYKVSASKAEEEEAARAARTGWADLPSPYGRWVTAWVARYDVSSSAHLVVYDHPAAIGYMASQRAAEAVGISRPIVTHEWRNLGAGDIAPLPLLIPTPLQLVRQCVAAPFELTATASLRCSWCLHLATAEDPLLGCCGAEATALLGSGHVAGAACGKYCHISCLPPALPLSDAAARVAARESLAQRLARVRKLAADGVLSPVADNIYVSRTTAAPSGAADLQWCCGTCKQCAMCNSSHSRGPSVQAALENDRSRSVATAKRNAAASSRPARYLWAAVDPDERGVEPDAASWEPLSYKPVPGDSTYTARLRALYNKASLPPTAWTEAMKDRDEARARARAQTATSRASGGVRDHETDEDEEDTTPAALDSTCRPELPFDYDGPLRTSLLPIPIVGVAPDAAVNLHLCTPCSKRIGSSMFCPICHGAYRNDSGHMVACDGCAGWVHGRCDGLSPADLSAIERGEHAAWGSRYLCAVCRRARMATVLGLLRMEDRGGYFLMPVTAEIAPGYTNIISTPMDLYTIGSRLDTGVYDTVGLDGIQAFRADCELIVRNAFVFNTPQDKVYKDAAKWLRAAAGHFAKLLPMTHDKAYADEFARLRTIAKGAANNDTTVASTVMVDDLSAFASPGHRSGAASHMLSSPSLTASGTSSSISTALVVAASSDGDGPTEGGRLSGFARRASIGEKNLRRTGAQRIAGAGAIVLPEEYRPLPHAPPISLQPVVASAEVVLPAAEAHIQSVVDGCATCGSHGDPRFLVFCLDCGEAHHVFCVLPTLFARLFSEAAAMTPVLAAHVELLASLPAPGTLLSPAQAVALMSPAFFELLGRFVNTSMWRCASCKICEVCGECRPEQEDKLLVCDTCDAGYHTFCCSPMLAEVPDGEFHCSRCVACKTCGASSVGGQCINNATPASQKQGQKRQSTLPVGAWSTSRDHCHACVPAPDKTVSSLSSTSDSHSARAAVAATPRAAEPKPLSSTEMAQCPVCRKRWSDTDKNMAACDSCGRWAHCGCDPLYLSEAVFTSMGEVDDTAQYFCPDCRTNRGQLFAALEATTKHANRMRALICSVVKQLPLQASCALVQPHSADGEDSSSTVVHAVTVAPGLTASISLTSASFAIDAVQLRFDSDACFNARLAAISVRAGSSMQSVTNGTSQAVTGAGSAGWRSVDVFEKIADPLPLLPEPGALSSTSAMSGGNNHQPATKRTAGSTVTTSKTAKGLAGRSLLPFAVGMLAAPREDVVLAAQAAVARQQQLKETAVLNNGTPLFTDTVGTDPPIRSSVAADPSDDDDGDSSSGSEGDGLSVPLSMMPHTLPPPLDGADVASALLLRFGATAEVHGHGGRQAASAPSEMLACPDPRKCCFCGQLGDMEFGLVHLQLAAARNVPMIQTGSVQLQLARSAEGASVQQSGKHQMAPAGPENIGRGIEGRLLPIPVSLNGTATAHRWISAHALCALWSSEVYEDGSSMLHMVQDAARRACHSRCHRCGFLGATVNCGRRNCPRTYHLRCAVVEHCGFHASKVVYCPLHTGSPAEERDQSKRDREKDAASAVVQGSFPPINLIFQAYLSDTPALGQLRLVNDALCLRVANQAATAVLEGRAGEDKIAVSLVTQLPSTSTLLKVSRRLPDVARGPPLLEDLVLEAENDLRAADDSEHATEGWAGVEELLASVGVHATRTSALLAHCKHAGLSPQAAHALLQRVNQQARQTQHDRWWLQWNPGAVDAQIALQDSVGIAFSMIAPLSDRVAKRSAEESVRQPKPLGSYAYPCLRVGALTVLRWGRIVSRRPGFHTAAHIFPSGYRARRIFWGPRVVNGVVHPTLARASYVCEVLDSYSAAMDDPVSLDAAKSGQNHISGALFRITCDQIPSLTVVADDADAALFQLRCQLLKLCGPQAAHLLSREEHALLAFTDSELRSGPEDTAHEYLAAQLLSPDASASRLRWRRVGGGPLSSAAADTYALQGLVFFGLAIPAVQKALETQPDAAMCMITPVGTSAWWPRYRFRYGPCPRQYILEARERREALARKLAAAADSCSRLTPYDRSSRDGVKHHKTSMLAARSTTLDDPELADIDRAAMGLLQTDDPATGGAGGNTAGEQIAAELAGVSSSSLLPSATVAAAASVQREVEVAADLDRVLPYLQTASGGAGAAELTRALEVQPVLLPTQKSDGLGAERMRELFYAAKALTPALICVRRSPIHGWGLFLKQDVAKDTILIEYTGQLVRTALADRREVVYEEEARLTGRFAHMGGAAAAHDSAAAPQLSNGVWDMTTAFHVPMPYHHSDGSGSCYLFASKDGEWIVDATYVGCAARFINHCCDPNCYSHHVSVDGRDRIIIVAGRDLQRGEELTYDYKFPSEEDPTLRVPCYCGSPSCSGFMN